MGQRARVGRERDALNHHPLLTAPTPPAARLFLRTSLQARVTHGQPVTIVQEPESTEPITVAPSIATGPTGQLPGRYRGTAVFMVLWMMLALVTRGVLLIHARREVDFHPVPLLGVFLWGALFDLAAGLVAVLPVHVYLWVSPARWLASQAHRRLLLGFFYLALCILLFVAAAEWFFWEEFTSRFNFIAVDYLVYTTEVVGNIRESYPLELILVVIGIIAGLSLWGLKLLTSRLPSWAVFNPGVGVKPDTRQSRWLGGIAGLLLPLVFQAGLSNRMTPGFGNAINQELARNGPYAFFAAYWENELSFDRFYPTVPPQDALRVLRPLLQEAHTSYTSTSPEDITRQVQLPGPEHRWNVLQITVESLSAKYLGCFGNSRGLTPHLDRLAAEGIVFTNLYATGTRTVRGMEALSLSVPPTPGQSIVRRPNNAHLFSMGSVLAAKGYESSFIYSGFGYFDNMNAFFAANGYRVLDRAMVAKEDITYATVWGACDEDLYRWTLREADAAHSRGTPFHHFVMTTSNHRPFGFPDGRIDLPTGRRLSAVKYTDFAIGQLIAAARQRPWFTNTLFLIVGDHCASAAGKAALPVDGYHIPAILWNPSLIQPRQVGTLCSQIDLPPTVLGLMNWSYATRFFGRDILRLPPTEGRAFISTYQKLGYLKGNRLEVLDPIRRHQSYRQTLPDGDWEPVANDDAMLGEAIAYYESASYLFNHRQP